MKLKFKEDPTEWRKAVWLSALGLGFASSVLCWRHVLPPTVWKAILVILALAAIVAPINPRLFRGYYRFSHRLNSFITEILGRIALAFIFIVVVTPLGLLMRMTGKDPLRLRRQPNATTYWRPAPPLTPLDRLF